MYYFQIRLLVAVIYTLIFWAFTAVTLREDRGLERAPTGTRYRPFTSNTLLPTYIGTLVFLMLIPGVRHIAADQLTTSFFDVFILLLLYFAILIPLLPFLRKTFDPRICASLWMVPNLLYIALIYDGLMEIDRPLLVIRAPERLVTVLFWIWLTGFSAIMLYKIGAHLYFRHKVLQNTREVTDPEILQLWTDMQVSDGVNPLLSLTPVISPHVETPLSVGFFKATIVLVLPETTYSVEELELIFRHELIHIQRQDAASKFFMAFCTALYWFNPLMWKAMKHCADDLELSCDESVLENASEETRHRYASLILQTAGNGKGFTTCLSASAEGLRYRLKNIIAPVSRRTGSLIIALVIMVLFMSVGHIALTYDQLTGAEAFRIEVGEEIPQLTAIKGYTQDDDMEGTTYACKDEAALYQYIHELQLHKITGNYVFEPKGHYLELCYPIDLDSTAFIALSDDSIHFTPFAYGTTFASYYYITQDIDWEYIESLLEPIPH